ncbi:hypothetical protein GALL_545050 [mine drainage metagenome]|uniref:Uncharacterized protein n=1 Tax=mine drainage metagenome TaxID=410659 RepID=A0A1J5P8Z1_9ZZZZ
MRRCQRMVAAQPADGDVQLAGFEIADVVERVHGDVDVRICRLEIRQTRNQPHARQRGEGCDLHAGPCQPGAQGVHRGVEAVQRLAHDGSKLLSRRRQPHPRPFACEQRHAHTGFERLDLPAQRRLGQRQLLRCGGKAAQPRSRLEAAQISGIDLPTSRRRGIPEAFDVSSPAVHDSFFA